MQGAVAVRLRALFYEIGYAYDITIEEMEVASGHVHLFCAFPPRLSIVQVSTRLKGLPFACWTLDLPAGRWTGWRPT